MDLGLRESVALVAGSSRGIGLATARAFLAEGARTVVTGRDLPALEAAQASLTSEATGELLMVHQGDLRNTDVIARLLTSIHDRWGRLDCVVANLGSGRGASGSDLQESDWTDFLEQNLASAYRLVQQVLPLMKEAHRGSIVLVASIAGLESTGAPLPYSAAKAALVSYGNNLARELGPLNVRVNTVAPGNVLFPGGSWERHLADRRSEVMHQIETDVPLRRFGRPEEIADAIVFLSSARATFITGSCVVVDGGQTRSA